MLLVGLGRATRLLRFLTDLPKRYVGEVVLGVSTTTLDDEGEVTGQWDMSHVTLAKGRAAAALLTGPILQIPPMVSAVRVGGRRLHELAREGIEVERAPRPVNVDRFDVEPGESPGVWRIDVTCGSGTYIRVLAADLGAALGGGAHLRGLRRQSIGSFGVDSARTLEMIEADPGAAVISPAAALVDYASTAVDAETAAQVGHGRPLPPERLGLGALGPADQGPWVVVDPDGSLIAVYERRASGTPGTPGSPGSPGSPAAPGGGGEGEAALLFPAVVL